MEEGLELYYLFNLCILLIKRYFDFKGGNNKWI